MTTGDVVWRSHVI